MGLEVIVLAAGLGSRMQSNQPKVLHNVGGKPMLSHVVDSVLGLQPDHVHVVIHPTMVDLPLIREKALHPVTQKEQLGSGHAASVVVPYLKKDSTVLVVNGDGPLITSHTLKRCVDALQSSSLSIVSANVENPEGYGRIIRGPDGQVLSIVEDADLEEDQRGTKEVNSGILATSAHLLEELLPQIQQQNSQNEIYLTDLLALVRCSGKKVEAVLAEDADEIKGVNTRKQLAEVEKIYRQRRAGALLEEGVTLIDPERIDIRGSVRTGIDCNIDVNVILEGEVKLGDNVQIGPNCLLSNVEIGDDTVIRSHSVVEDTVLGSRCKIGPFARIRPNSKLGDDVRIGNFVELKNAELDQGAKAGHIAYLGDVSVGADTNIGAGVITCNFDGQAKHQTKIGDRVFVGTNASLVAPLVVSDDVFIAAGSTITRDLEEGAFAIARERQRDIPGGAQKVLKST